MEIWWSERLETKSLLLDKIKDILKRDFEGHENSIQFFRLK